MKIKIIFTSPPNTEEKDPRPHDVNEKIIFIKDPYTITSIDGGRKIEAEDQSTITYEEYCAHLKTIINETISAQKLDELDQCEAISVEDWKEPPNFDALHKALAKAHIPFTSPCEMTIINGSYGGDLYVNATRHLVKSAQSKDHQVLFNITLTKKIPGEETLLAIDNDDLILTEHDKAKLAVSRNITFFPSPDSLAVTRHFTDDQLVGRQVKSTRTTQDDAALKRYPSLASELSNPTFFYREELSKNRSQQGILRNFFSQMHQQQGDYTCGPSAIKMISNYYTTVGKRPFCGEAIPDDHQQTFAHLNATEEMSLALQVGTTEEIGSEISDMRDGLNQLGLTVIDQSEGFIAETYGEADLKSLKQTLWDKLKDIFKLGVPILINLQDRKGIGHYEVAIGIDPDENIILADPASALWGKVEFETVPKDKFIDRWKNMSGERHGRFLLIPPNDASAKEVESILSEVPHYYNGERISQSDKQQQPR